MIKINAKRKFVPVKIGENTFEFSLSDNAIVEMQKSYAETVKEIELIDTNKKMTTEEQIISTKEIEKKSFDLLLGEGAFEKIYNEVQSTTVMMEILSQLIDELPPAIEEAYQSDILKKYLGE